MSNVLTFEPTGPCWICGSSERRLFATAPLDFRAWHEQDPGLAAYSGETILLYRCKACGFSQPNKIPGISRYFDRMYDQRWSADWVAHEFSATYKDAIFGRILRVLASKVTRRPRKVLDIGSHVGRFLYLAGQDGWVTHGTEINSRTATFASEHSQSTIHRVSAECVDEIGVVFDAVTLTDVLEHLPKPLEILKKVNAVLDNDGWISVKVPCAPAQLIKEKVRSYIRPNYQITIANNLVHISHFSPRSLRLALEQAGFYDIEIEVGAPEFPRAADWSAVFRRSVWTLARLLPFGIYTPLALNLQAFARKRAGSS